MAGFRVASLMPLAVLALLVVAVGVPAQDKREAEQKLRQVRGELKDIAQERRRLESQRGEASRQLREADEQVGSTTRTLAETDAALRREEAALQELQARRVQLQAQRERQQRQLATLVRSAYLMGDNTALKVLLSQDRVTDAARTLAYHRYLQQDSVADIGRISTDLASLGQVEQEIEQRRIALQATREQQRTQMASLRQARQSRAVLMAELDQKYQDRSSREKALGQDARALERLLANLRAAAARAEAERRAAAKRAQEEKARQQANAATGAPAPAVAAKPAPPRVASAPALKVGGLGWPLSGNLLASYGGKMPDGRASAGVLIGAPAGSTVTAVADGTVVFSEWMTGYGLILIIDHGNGYMSLYAHNDSLLRDAGAQVKRGDAVAKVGTSGGQGTSALYFELRRNGQPVDPASWLQRR